MLVITIFLLYFVAFFCAATAAYMTFGSLSEFYEVNTINATIVWAITDLIGIVAIVSAVVLLALAEVLKKIHRDDKTPL